MAEHESFCCSLSDGEQNFEMVRANVWFANHLNCTYTFENLVAFLSEPEEVSLEMVHMLHYVKKKDSEFDLNAWSSPYFSAELWIHRSHFQNVTLIQKIQHQSQLLQSSDMSCRSLNESELICDNQVDSALEDTHRPLPGYGTILQCGKTLYGDSIFNKSDSVDLNYSAVRAREINQMFNGTVTTFSRTNLSTIISSRGYESSYQNTGLPTSLRSKETDSLSNRFMKYPQYQESLMIGSGHSKYSRSFANQSLVHSLHTSEQPSSRHAVATTPFQMNNQSQSSHYSRDKPLSSTDNADAAPTSNIFKIFYDPYGMETSSIDVKPISHQSDPRLTRLTSSNVKNPVDTVDKSGTMVLEDVSKTERSVLCSLDNTTSHPHTLPRVENMDDSYFLDMIGIDKAPPTVGTVNMDMLNSPTTLLSQLIDKALNEK